MQVELIDKYGYNPETHTVATYDEYILEMHRITGPKNNSNPNGKPAVFLMHGLLMSSADWIILGPKKALGRFRNIFWKKLQLRLQFEIFLNIPEFFGIW